ncbi:MAG: RNA polymerase sigma factor [Bacteroidetes bacterium]|nr:RNA polymerase sigma factor [Bacteroidota bacterium]
MSLDKSGKKDLYLNPDEELIDDCRMNDRKAQLELYKRYYKAMYNTAYRITKHTAEAEDAMQEAFLDAFRKIDTYSGEAAFGAWLRRIVVNKSIDHLKKQEKWKMSDMDDKDIPEVVEENPVEILSYKVDLIRKEIENLPDRYRVILSLHLLEGYDHEEITQILGLSYNATRTKYSRARQKLILALRGKNLDPNLN